jgi:hypothetical protein
MPEQMAAHTDGTPAGEVPDDGESTIADPAYHLLLAPEEVPVTLTALDLLIADVAHDAQIRELARAVISRLPATQPAPTSQDTGATRGEAWTTSIPLRAPEMKIVHTALHLLLDDLQREQADEVQVLHRIIDKLPDEHAIRAISLD